MTKEEKIEAAAIKYANTQPGDNWNAAKLGYTAGMSDALEDINEYAKQQAIAFAEWYGEQKWDSIGEVAVEGAELVPRYIPKEAAYDKFIEQQNIAK